MKHFYAFETADEIQQYEEMINDFKVKIQDYQRVLEEQFELKDAPKAVIWTTSEAATQIFSDTPIPAFTRKDLIYLSPDLTWWSEMFLSQLQGKDLPIDIHNFFRNFSGQHLLAILGHELTHHLDLFYDDFEDERENSIWFEEGMCEYLPRKLMLGDEEFEKTTSVEKHLVEAFQDDYGHRPLDDFGTASYDASLASIFFDYRRSYLLVKHLVEGVYQGNIQAVFADYKEWYFGDRKQSLTSFFEGRVTKTLK
ncbi:collagenase [Jeotgalibacillus sp. R-1-5s-1]|uniref:collagenase n=1 Tax=Jeotgalibacillus sp. R-1-5s-1 TaxID=2555897 RepID=UPI00106AFE7E|nr:collagenase [Jeotgalibacillus sp. R-1-5s-1]TFE00855.1 hypothetical protein E2491_04925 [Jeotgalibacillus sp. R-1-5s-1]